MKRFPVLPLVLVSSLAVHVPLVASFATEVASGGVVQSGAPATTADAAPFIGEWTLTLQGDRGPGTFDLAVKAEKEKVTAEIAGPTVLAQAISDITKAGQSLVLSYSFNYEGNPVDAVVRLTPTADGRTTAEIAFAGGAYVMSGTATRKEKAQSTPTQSAADVSGTWTGTMETPAGPITNTITLKSAQVTGSVSLGDYGQGTIENGKLDGDKISFQVAVESGKLSYQGTVAGDALNLTVTGTTGNQYNLIAKRQK